MLIVGLTTVMLPTVSNTHNHPLPTCKLHCLAVMFLHSHLQENISPYETWICYCYMWLNNRKKDYSVDIVETLSTAAKWQSTHKTSIVYSYIYNTHSDEWYLKIVFVVSETSTLEHYEFIKGKWWAGLLLQDLSANSLESVAQHVVFFEHSSSI